MNTISDSDVWVFTAASRNSFPGGIFRTKVAADQWIQQNSLSGVLTRYPVDIGVYDWAVQHNLFRPNPLKPVTPDIIGGFSSASQEHYHFENGHSG